MVNRPDSNSSTSTASTKGLSPSRNTKTMTSGVRSSLTRSNSDHDYKNNRKTKTTGGLRNSSSFQNVNKPMVNGNQSTRSSQILTAKVIRQRNNSMDGFDQTNLGSSASSSQEDNINVVVRVRPLSEKEKRNRDEMVAQFPGNGQILCEGITGAGQSAVKPKLFSYNVVFEPGATQEDVIEYSGIKRLIEMAIEGFSATCFCYGQTGSGKTHTLTGPPDLFIGKPNPQNPKHGLIFRSFFYLFKLLQEKPDINFVLKASFLEIYNEKVIDLLNPGSARKPLAVRWSKKSRGFFVENLFTVDCEELDDLLAVLEEGMRNRSVGSHMMNDYSSRSHTMLTVHITSEQQAENGVFISKQGKINFVDLAGSEMTKKTHSEGKTLEEANNINKSLMVLGYCIAQLSDSKKKGSHIPYRDSKLTKLLADSLAGNGVTLMIACISPARSNITETVNTLRYAARAKKIRTKPIIVMDPREALILSLKREVNALKQENDHLKSALNFHPEQYGAIPISQGSPIDVNERTIIPAAPEVNVEKLTELENNELSELVKLYMTENQALRQENSDLYSTREMIMRDQEVVCRENERLLKKLEDVNSVCCRSPIIPARPTFAGDVFNFSANSDSEILSNSNYWRNPLSASTDSVASSSKYNQKNDQIDGRISVNENKIPDSIQKEMDKRRIGDSISTIANSLKRNNSWERSPPSQTNGHHSASSRGKGSADSARRNNNDKNYRFVDMIH